MFYGQEYAQLILLVKHVCYFNQQNLPAKEQGKAKRPRPRREIHEMKALSRRKSIQG